MSNYNQTRWKFIFLAVAVFLAVIALWQMRNMVRQIAKEEQEKVRIWAEAINKKSEMVTRIETFFKEVRREERNRMSLFVEAQRKLIEQPLGSEINFYTRFITENNIIPVIVTDENNQIQLTKNIDIPDSVKVLSGKLLMDFSQEIPFSYVVYGMHFRIYYKESKIYTDLRAMLNEYTQSFLSEITDNTVFVPVLITDSSQTKVIAYGNISTQQLLGKEQLQHTISNMRSENQPIEIILPNDQKAYVFYEQSYLLKSMKYFPIIYLFVAFVFILVAYNLFNTFRTSEQNKLWIGMSKETAHQLGTPISSLLAWTEYMKMKGFEDEMVTEVTKDVDRLEIIAQRFSKIGSLPELKSMDLLETLENAVEYLKKRSSRQINYHLNFPKEKKICIQANVYLLHWVIENLCKNAIDAMAGVGDFTIDVEETEKQVIIDVSDTGKGIPKKFFKRIFTPGYSSKQRGWGLGLSLTKRIVEDYHGGKIFVKSSVVGKGTTFRIILKKKSLL